MKKIGLTSTLLLFLLSLSLGVSYGADAEQTSKNPEDEIPGAFLIVGTFKDLTDKAPESMMTTLDSQLEMEMAQTKKIPMVERVDEEYLDELVWANEDDMVDPERIPKSGNLVGAKYYLTPKVSHYAASAWGENTALPNVFENSWKLSVTVTAKILSVETGQILETFEIAKSISGKSEGPTRLTSVPNLTGVQKDAAKSIAGELTARVIDTLFPVMIADVVDGEIYLNQGSATGIQAGDRFMVYSKGKAICDPQTERILGYRERTVGSIEVLEVQREMSIAKIGDANGDDLEVGMTCKPINKAVTKKSVVTETKKEVAPPPQKEKVRKAYQKEEKKKEESGKRLFCLSDVLNRTSAPRRVEQAIHGFVGGVIRQAKDVKLVTRSDRELTAIGEEFLKSKSRMMDKDTALKTMKLCGARYMIFLEITDWVDAVEKQQLPLMSKPIEVLVVNISLHGSVIDLKTGEVLSEGQVSASSPKNEVVVDSHGDLNMQVKIAEEAADKYLQLLTADGVMKWDAIE